MVALLASTIPDDERNYWRTPPALYARLNRSYGPFQLDVAANEHNHLCPLWLGPGGLAEDALTIPWRVPGHIGGGPVRAFCNPPYSRGMIDRFMRKGWHEARVGNARTTFLVLAAVEQPWWHELVWDARHRRFRPGVEVEFPEGRVHFLRPNGSKSGGANFPSVLVTFGGW